GEVGADVVLANDPDGDRLAVAVPDPAGGYRLLTGNHIGVLLADHLLAGSDVDRPLVVSSIVSTPMVHAVAERYDARSEVTLTGFKWICAAARVIEPEDQRTFVYGFEEALGSSVGTVVRDKDGIGAAAAFADLVRSLAAEGRTVLDRWAELCRRHGLWVSHQHSVTLPGAEGQQRIAQAMGALTGGVPGELAGHTVTSHLDFRVGAEQRPPWLGEHDLVSMELDDGRAMIRPSGTEPKCKIYVDLRAELGADDDLDARTAELTEEARAVASALAVHVGLEDA
ncbi:MAG: phospho-sugar mutase, partial [Actinomycetota bacterium]